MATVDITKLLVRQRKLYELDHKSPMELKSVAYEFGREWKPDQSLVCCNPEFICLPWNDGPFKALDEQQRALLSAAFFSNFYAHTASNELYSLNYNVAVADRVFEPFSDSYLVLFQETDEEFDHILAFRELCNVVGRRPGIIGQYYKLGGQILKRYENKLGAAAFGGLYLLYRFVLNMSLKQTEGFMFRDLDASSCFVPAKAITEGHAHDEARHQTTSLELGLDLLFAAPKEEREKVADLLAVVVASLVQRRFPSDGDESKSLDAELAAQAVEIAAGVNRAAFEGLVDRFQSDDVVGEYESSESLRLSRRWLARQSLSLIERAGLLFQDIDQGLEGRLGKIAA